MKALRTLFIILLIIVVLALGGLGYLGFVPAVSKVMGTNMQRELDVETSLEGGYSAIDKMNIPENVSDLEAFINNPEAFKDFDCNLDSEELTSFLAYGYDESFPLKHIQVKINEDDSVEASAYLDVGYLGTYLGKTGVSAEVVERVMSFIPDGSYIPFYLYCSGDVSSGKVNLSYKEIEIGRVKIPSNTVDKYTSDINWYGSKVLEYEGYDILSASVDEGKLSINGDRELNALTPYFRMIKSDIAEQ